MARLHGLMTTGAVYAPDSLQQAAAVAVEAGMEMVFRQSIHPQLRIGFLRAGVGEQDIGIGSGGWRHTLWQKVDAASHDRRQRRVALRKCDGARRSLTASIRKIALPTT